MLCLKHETCLLSVKLHLRHKQQTNLQRHARLFIYYKIVLKVQIKKITKHAQHNYTGVSTITTITTITAVQTAVCLYVS